jgi:hypothetical protein
MVLNDFGRDHRQAAPISTGPSIWPVTACVASVFAGRYVRFSPVFFNLTTPMRSSDLPPLATKQTMS